MVIKATANTRHCLSIYFNHSYCKCPLYLSIYFNSLSLFLSLHIALPLYISLFPSLFVSASLFLSLPLPPLPLPPLSRSPRPYLPRSFSSRSRSVSFTPSLSSFPLLSKPFSLPLLLSLCLYLSISVCFFSLSISFPRSLPPSLFRALTVPLSRSDSPTFLPSSDSLPRLLSPSPSPSAPLTLPRPLPLPLFAPRLFFLLPFSLSLLHSLFSDSLSSVSSPSSCPCPSSGNLAACAQDITANDLNLCLSIQ